MTFWSSYSCSVKLVCSWNESTVGLLDKMTSGLRGEEEGEVGDGKGAASARCKPLKLHDAAFFVVDAVAETDVTGEWGKGSYQGAHQSKDGKTVLWIKPLQPQDAVVAAAETDVTGDRGRRVQNRGRINQKRAKQGNNASYKTGQCISRWVDATACKSHLSVLHDGSGGKEGRRR